MKAGAGLFGGIRRSFIAATVAAMLGVLSMGALGGMLYYAVYPVLAPWHGSMDAWHGDWVWPATVSAGVLWSLGFVCAGLCYARLERAGVDVATRRASYVVVLWLSAVCSWTLVLLSA
ncbi:MAG: hypothetical protein ACTJGZ_10475 [Kerstersia sp.]